MKILAKHNCKLTRRLLHERLDGDLGPADARRLEACLTDCPACAEYAARLTQAVSLLRAAGPAPAPEYLPRRIRAAAARVPRETAPVPLYRPRLATAGAVVMLALIAAFAVHHESLLRLPAASTVAAGPAPGPLASAPAAERMASLPPALAAPPARHSWSASAPMRLAARHAHAAPAPAPDPDTQRYPHPGPAWPGSVADAQPANVERGPAPTELSMAEQRVAVAPTAKYAAGEGAFTDQAVGSLVAGAMLTSYTDGEPAGVQTAAPGGSR